MGRVFMIGDIHGCSKTFRKLVLSNINIKKSDKIYCLGDYIDRGPDSKGVIDFILELRVKGYKVHTLRGNHEEMLMNSLNDERAKEHWINNGGDATLNSFNLNFINKINPYYLNFLKRTKYYIKTKDFIVVHAGLNFSIENPLLDKKAMLWIRNFKSDDKYLNGKKVVHGHTPIHRDDLISQNLNSVINIDGGCVYKDRDGLGSLFALDFKEGKLIEARNID